MCVYEWFFHKWTLSDNRVSNAITGRGVNLTIETVRHTSEGLSTVPMLAACIVVGVPCFVV
jgi:hypothetical protein